jgi:NAD(P)H-flavin reductase
MAPEVVPDAVPYRVVQRADFSDVTYLLEIHEPEMARAAQPGQFVMVMTRPDGERIPLTIADFDRDRGTITLVIQAVGKTTREMQREMVEGAHLHAMVGPMGIPSQLDGRRKVICVGGGLGVAPVYPQARALRAAGAYVIGVVGFRNRDLVFWKDRFEAVCDELILCSDDGSVGMRGLVTDGLRLALAGHPDADEVIAIGPPVMMRACAEVTRPLGVHTVVSLNPIMVDGTGMCGGCRVKVAGRMRFACVDGPDFDAHAVDFDDLMVRLRRFRELEQVALDRWTQGCRIADEPEAQGVQPTAAASAVPQATLHVPTAAGGPIG